MKRALPIVRPTSVHQCHALGLGAPRELTDDGHGQACPFIGCADHLVWAAIGVQTPSLLKRAELLAALDKIETIELDSLDATCARQTHTLESVGALWDVTRERARQIETKALKKLRHPSRTKHLAEHAPEGRDVSRPDLQEPRTTFPSIRELQEGVARIDPTYARTAEDLSRRHGGSLTLGPAKIVQTGRVLVGEERAQRIAELKTRKGGAR